VNAGIDKESFSLQYGTVDDAVRVISNHGRGTLMAKLDIRNAFRLIPAHSTLRKQRMDVIISVFKYLGGPIADEKTEGPTTKLTFLGIELDSIDMVARLPDDKVHDLRLRLHTFRQCRSCRLHEIQ